jgi:predicted DNA-binding transcriptional regulator YafY
MPAENTMNPFALSQPLSYYYVWYARRRDSEAIRNILKSWIPNITILAPQEFRQCLLKDVQGWVKRQEKCI